MIKNILYLIKLAFRIPTEQTVNSEITNTATSLSLPVPSVTDTGLDVQEGVVEISQVESPMTISNIVKDIVDQLRIVREETAKIVEAKNNKKITTEQKDVIINDCQQLIENAHSKTQEFAEILRETLQNIPTLTEQVAQNPDYINNIVQFVNEVVSKFCG